MMEELCGLRFFLKKSLFLFFDKKVVAAIYRLIPNANSRDGVKRLRNVFKPCVRRIPKVAVDVRGGDGAVAVEDGFLTGTAAILAACVVIAAETAAFPVRCMESDYHAMDVRLVERLIVPSECTMREVDFKPLRKQRLPQVRHRSALAD